MDVARSPFLRLHRLPSAEGRARGSWSSRQSARGLASAWVFWSQADPGHTFILAATELSRARARAALLCVQTRPRTGGLKLAPRGFQGGVGRSGSPVRFFKQHLPKSKGVHFLDSMNVSGNVSATLVLTLLVFRSESYFSIFVKSKTDFNEEIKDKSERMTKRAV